MKRGSKSVLTKELLLYENSDVPGIIYVSPEMVTDIKYCNYVLGWDTS